MLEAFRHVILASELGTFTEAARQAHLSQPAFSASIARLEEELGARLFDRGRHGATLSAAGVALLPHAQACIAAAEDARRAVRALQALDAGELRVGAGATACTYLLPTVFAAFVERHPAVALSLQELTTDESLEALRRGEIDLALIGRGLTRRDQNASLDGLESERWLIERLLLVGPPGKGDLPFLTFRRGASTRALFERAFPDALVAMELGSIAAIKAHVAEGIGRALISEHAVSDELERGDFVQLEDRRVPIRRELRLVYRGRERLSPAAEALRQLMRQ